jgi:hypothetical protein
MLSTKLIVSEAQDGYIPSGQKRFFAGHGISCSAQISSQTSRPLAAQLRHEISLGAMGAPFRPLLDSVGSTTSDQTEATQRVQAPKAEAAKGKHADVGVIAKLISGLVQLVPSAVGAVVSVFATPILARVAGPATKFVL